MLDYYQAFLGETCFLTQTQPSPLSVRGIDERLSKKKVTITHTKQQLKRSAFRDRRAEKKPQKKHHQITSKKRVQ